MTVWKVAAPKPITSYFKPGNHAGDLVLMVPPVKAGTRGEDASDRWLTPENKDHPVAHVAAVVVFKEDGRKLYYFDQRITPVRLAKQIIRDGRDLPLLGVLERPGKAWELIATDQKTTDWVESWLGDNADRSESGDITFRNLP